MNALTLSKHRPRKFWGWGYDDDQLTSAEHMAVAARARQVAGRDGLTPGAPPKTSHFDLRRPRIEPPAALASSFSTTPHDRLSHAYGRSFPDILRMWMRDVPNPPDLVAFPENEEHIATILDWAGRNNVAVIPFGGGSSVVGGVEPAVGDGYSAAIALDLERFDKVHEIDRSSRAARIGAGIYGPAQGHAFNRAAYACHANGVAQVVLIFQQDEEAVDNVFHQRLRAETNGQAGDAGAG